MLLELYGTGKIKFLYCVNGSAWVVSNPVPCHISMVKIFQPVGSKVEFYSKPHPVDHLLLQLRSSTLESHKATTRTALLNR